MEKGHKCRWAVQTAVSAMTVVCISGLVEIYGLYDRIYFNKGIISIGVFLLSMLMVRKGLEGAATDRRGTVIAYLLSVLLMFTEIWGTGLRLKANGADVLLSLQSALWMTGSAWILAWLAEPFFFWLLHLSKEGTGRRRSGKELNRIFLISWLVVFLSYIPCFLAFFPGLYCYDMIWQWRMFNSGIFNTHHPLIHTLFSGGLLELGNHIFGSYQGGLALHSLVQLGFLSASIALAIRYMVKLRLPVKAWGAGAAFYILYPFFPVLGISTTKDILFGSLLLVVFVCLCDMGMERRIYRGWKLAGFLAAAVLMGLFRNNAVYGLCFTVVCLLLVYGSGRIRKRKNRLVLQFIMLFTVIIIGTEGLFVVMEKGMDAEKGSVAEMLSVPCQQLARTYVFHEDEISREDKEELFLFIDEEALAGYKYYVSDPVKAGMDAEYLGTHKKDFLALWYRIGRQFPEEYLLAPAYNTMGIWYMGGDSSCFVAYDMSPPYDEDHVVASHSLLPRLQSGYRWFSDARIQKNLPMISILLYTSFYAWMVVICMAAAWQKRNYLYLIPLVLLFGYMLTLLLGPCITVRYMMGILLCVPVAVAAVFFENGEQD